MLKRSASRFIYPISQLLSRNIHSRAALIVSPNYVKQQLQLHPIRRSLLYKHIYSTVKCPSSRGFLQKMKLDSPQFNELFTPELQELEALFRKNDYELRIAGGAVRDLLMGKKSHDVDFATTATPDQMKEMFELAGVRMINAKGESHGTITARINDKENFEVTTLRIDVVTDGRHAEVEFTKDWQLDANRRDLTINAMFLGFDGTVYDFFNGMEDVKNRRVKFVGKPADRIKEDYLRILRYFRFYGRISEMANEHEEETLTAIKENAVGLSGISGERIWTELKKIVVGNHAAALIKVMADTGISKYMGLPQQVDVEEFDTVCDRTKDMEPQPMTRVAALLTSDTQVYDFNQRLKMSTEELQLGLFIVKYRDQQEGEDLFTHYTHLTARLAGKEQKVKNKVTELLKYKGHTAVLEQFQEYEMPRLPINGKDLIERGLKKGPIFSKVLDRLRNAWIDSDFKLTKEELLSQFEEVLNAIKE